MELAERKSKQLGQTRGLHSRLSSSLFSATRPSRCLHSIGQEGGLRRAPRRRILIGLPHSTGPTWVLSFFGVIGVLNQEVEGGFSPAKF
jgi:hypothetical protein